jgi:hypothetical protein
VKDYIILQVCSNHTYFVWQTQLWLESLYKLGIEKKAYVIIYVRKDADLIGSWYQMANHYTDVNFLVYYDEGGFVKPEDRALYIPIMRFYCLHRFYSENENIVKTKAVFYCDSDILLLKNFNIEDLLNDDIFYMSDTIGYISASYFDRKKKDVLPDKLSEYEKIDVLDTACKIVGIDRSVAEKNEKSSGGAQYVLKYLDASFWEKCYYDCLNIRLYLANINKEYFGSEANGFQSWTSDMWAILWNLWYHGKNTQITKKLDFCMATSKYSCLEGSTIYHNAGVTANHDTRKFFYKGNYRDRNPFTDPDVEVVYNNPEAKEFAGYYYVKEIVEFKKSKRFKII